MAHGDLTRNISPLLLGFVIIVMCSGVGVYPDHIQPMFGIVPGHWDAHDTRQHRSIRIGSMTSPDPRQERCHRGTVLTKAPSFWERWIGNFIFSSCDFPLHFLQISDQKLYLYFHGLYPRSAWYACFSDSTLHCMSVPVAGLSPLRTF